MKKHLAFIVPYRFVPPTNGGHKAAFNLARAMAENENFWVISTTDNPADAPTPFSLYRLISAKKRKYFSPFTARQTGKFLQRKNVSACLLHQPFIGWVLAPILRKQKIDLYVWVQNLEYQRFRSMGKWYWPIVKWAEGLIYRKARKLFFISPDDIEPAIRAFKLNPQHCLELPYCINRKKPANNEELQRARSIVKKRHGIGNEERLFLFFGPQSYQPNREAVQHILLHINPLLQKKADFPYRIIICGGGLSKAFRQMPACSNPHILYAGFVENIEEYILAADLVLNPITSGGGVKIKVLEALALGKSVLSFQQGALGVKRETCPDKLHIVSDHHYRAFAQAAIKLLSASETPTPSAFYAHYSETHVRHILEKSIDET